MYFRPLPGAGHRLHHRRDQPRRKAAASQSWPTAPGVVVSAAVHESVNQNEDGPDTYSYQPKIVYTYQVGGASYQSDRYSFGAGSANRGSVEQVIARYTPGMAVSVRYNPEKPTEAVLQSEAGGANIFLIAGIVLTVIGVLIACVAIAIVVLASIEHLILARLAQHQQGNVVFLVSARERLHRVDQVLAHLGRRPPAHALRLAQ